MWWPAKGTTKKSALDRQHTTTISTSGYSVGVVRNDPETIRRKALDHFGRYHSGHRECADQLASLAGEEMNSVELAGHIALALHHFFYPHEERVLHRGAEFFKGIVRAMTRDEEFGSETLEHLQVMSFVFHLQMMQVEEDIRRFS